MSETIQWCDGPRPRVKRPSHTAWFDSACCAIATGCRVWTGTTAVASSTCEVTRPMSAMAVSASKSFGTWGTQIDVKPAFSAASASARSRATFSRYRPFSAPIMRPIRTVVRLPPGVSRAESNERQGQWQSHSLFSRVILRFAAAIVHTQLGRYVGGERA